MTINQGCNLNKFKRSIRVQVSIELVDLLKKAIMLVKGLKCVFRRLCENTYITAQSDFDTLGKTFVVYGVQILRGVTARLFAVKCFAITRSAEILFSRY